ncbi:DNA-binding response OmpR family regulator [Desulfitispora alkaliphila]|uniref:response regulator transcription factor n=1 Tax=Desulfitispora alkaliphila TaxID=622674 RepID=UPI003D1E7D85
MEKILLIDDEKLLVKGLKKSLEQEGYEVKAVYDGRTALTEFQQGSYDLIVLDLMLPELDGLTVCREIRASSQVPIIMLTAKGEDVDKIIGLEMGADDYLSKPFNTRELLARIKAILRRYKNLGQREEKNELSFGKLKIDLAKHRIYVDDKEVNLTAKEYDILLLLVKHPGRIYSRNQLLEQIWGYDYIGEDRTVDVHVRRLREKVEENPGKPSYILTKWGVGYYFNQEEH